MNHVNLLLVDDEVAFLETISKRLTKRDCQVEMVHSGKAALEALENNKSIEVVILDVKMPEMDGVETLVEIKKRFPLVEVIMLTGHGTVETAIDGMKLGAFDYLIKPCEIDVLTAKAGEAAARKRRHEEKIVEARIREITERRA